MAISLCHCRNYEQKKITGNSKEINSVERGENRMEVESCIYVYMFVGVRREVAIQIIAHECFYP